MLEAGDNSANVVMRELEIGKVCDGGDEEMRLGPDP